MKRLAVLGQPVSHSLSPRMHNAAFAELGLDEEWSYEAIELSPEDFGTGVEELRSAGFVGANVTIPHKQAALALADRASEAARAIGAANTLSFGAAGIEAANTDAPGLIDALPSPPEGELTLVLGAGGSARAAVWALRRAGAEVEIWNRTAERAQALADRMGARSLGNGSIESLSRYGIVVNTTSLGLEEAAPGAGAASRTSGAVFKATPIRADQLMETQVVVDLVYGMGETGLIRVAKEAGAQTVDGLEILVRQGAASFKIWTGLSAPMATMRHAVKPKPLQQ